MPSITRTDGASGRHPAATASAAASSGSPRSAVTHRMLPATSGAAASSRRLFASMLSTSISYTVAFGALDAISKDSGSMPLPSITTWPIPSDRQPITYSMMHHFLFLTNWSRWGQTRLHLRMSSSPAERSNMSRYFCDCGDVCIPRPASMVTNAEVSESSPADMRRALRRRAITVGGAARNVPAACGKRMRTAAHHAIARYRAPRL